MMVIITCILIGLGGGVVTILLLISAHLQRRRLFKLGHYGVVVLICVGSVLAILAQWGALLHSPQSSPSLSNLSPSTSILAPDSDSSSPDHLLSLQASTGTIRWRVPVGSLYDNAVGKSIYEVVKLSSDTFDIVSLNAQTGKQQWQFNLTPANLGTDPARHSILVKSMAATNDYVYIVVDLFVPDTPGEFAMCSLHASDGTLVTCHNLSTYNAGETAPVFRLLTSGDTVLTYTGPLTQGSIQAFAGKDLSPLWQQAMNADSSLIGVGEYVYLEYGNSSKLRALRPQDGKEVWSSDDINLGAAIMTSSYMYGYTGTSLVAYDQQNGRSVWQQEITQDSTVTPVVHMGDSRGRQFIDEAGGTVYVLTDDLHLYGYNAMTGHKTVGTTLQLPGGPNSGCSIQIGNIAALDNTLIMPIQYRQNFSPFVTCPVKSFIAAFSANAGTPYWTYHYKDPYLDDVSLWVV